jgi:DNA-binding MarR family transcriptional regulator
MIQLAESSPGIVVTMSDACQNHPVASLIHVASLLQAHMDDVAHSVGITPTQARLLMRLDEPRRLSDLAEAQSCDPSSITVLVQRLERDGFVTRVIDRTDARARLIKLTPKGRKARTRFEEMIGDGSSALGDLTNEQRMALAAWFAPVSL